MKKCYSHNDEEFNYDNWQDAATVAWEENPDGKVGDIISIWEGDALPYKASAFTPNIAEQMQEIAYNETFGNLEDWDFSEEQKMELQDTINATVDEWAEKHNLHPNYYKVTGAVELKVRVLNEDGDCELVTTQEE